MLWEYANGIDHSPVESEPTQAKGIGNSVTLSKDLLTAQEAYPILRQLAYKVGKRLTTAGQAANNLCVEIKYATFDKYSRQMPTIAPTQNGMDLYKYSCQLFDALWNGNPIRLLGIRAGKLSDENEPIQLDLFSYNPEENAKKQKLNQAMESIRKRYGDNAIQKGAGKITK